MKRIAVLLLAVLVLAPLSAAAKDKVSYAYLIDPALEGILYGIKSGKVSSPKIDIAATPLPIPALIQSTTTKQYDVVMNAVLSIPRALDQGLKMEVLSTALRSVARAGRSRLLVNAVRAVFAIDHLFGWVPFGPGLLLVARKN